MARSKTRKYTKRRGLRKRRGTKRHNRRQTRRQSRRQYGGIGMTTSVDTNPNEMKEEEYMLAKQMKIID